MFIYLLECQDGENYGDDAAADDDDGNGNNGDDNETMQGLRALRKHEAKDFQKQDKDAAAESRRHSEADGKEGSSAKPLFGRKKKKNHSEKQPPDTRVPAPGGFLAPLAATQNDDLDEDKGIPPKPSRKFGDILGLVRSTKPLPRAADEALDLSKRGRLGPGLELGSEGTRGTRACDVSLDLSKKGELEGGLRPALANADADEVDTGSSRKMSGLLDISKKGKSGVQDSYLDMSKNGSIDVSVRGGRSALAVAR